jgi:hypothetical protein
LQFLIEGLEAFFVMAVYGFGAGVVYRQTRSANSTREVSGVARRRLTQGVV